MAQHLHLYLDDSGSRDLDRPVSLAAQGQGSRHFALGGVLVKEEDEAAIRAAHWSFCDHWQITGPLHSHDIRNKRGRFAWVGQLEDDERDRFHKELTGMLIGHPMMATACVIDRAGYDARYRALYGTRRWRMSKTAFTIVVERSAKVASRMGRKLKVWFEEHSKAEDRAVQEYFAALKRDGMPFDQGRSSLYQPLGADGFGQVLSSCERKRKSSPMIQIADLILFPVCIGGYDATHRAYQTLVNARRLIDHHLPQEDCASMGIKYSCFDDVGQKK